MSDKQLIRSFRNTETICLVDFKSHPKRQLELASSSLEKCINLLLSNAPDDCRLKECAIRFVEASNFDVSPDITYGHFQVSFVAEECGTGEGAK